MAETKAQHERTSRGLVRRSLGMLRAVRGLIVVLFLVGVIASALPYVWAAAFGPMMQVVADAGTSGNLGGVWDLQGPLVAREDGLLRSLAGPVPFAVLLATWAASLLLAQLMYFVNAWVGAKVERVLLGGHPATGARPPPVAVPGLLHRVAHWRADPAGDDRIRWRATPSDRLPASAAHRCGRVDRGNRLSAGHLVADDRRRAGPHAAGLDHAEVRRSPRPGGDATGDERGPRDGR